MLEKGKLSQFQLFSMMVLFMSGSSVILQSLVVSGRDSWISLLLATLVGTAYIILITSLALRLPGMTIIQYSEVLFGKLIGKMVGLLYLWYFLHLGSLVLRNFGDLFPAMVMSATPMWFFHATMGLVVAYLVYQKLEVLGRLSEFSLPISIGITVSVNVLLTLSGVVDYGNLSPVFEHGVSKVLLGAFPYTSFPFAETILFAMVFPYLNRQHACRKPSLLALLVSGIIMLSILVQNIGAFGEYLASLAFPRLSAVKLIMVGNFIERIEAFLLGFWIIGGLIKVGVCLFGFVLGLAQLLNLKDYRPLILPSTVLMIVIAQISYANTFEMLDFAVNIYPFYAFPIQVVLPLLMLAIAMIKGKKKQTQQQKN